MASRGDRTEARSQTGHQAPRLYLVTPQVDPGGIMDLLAAALGAADVAAVLLRLPAADDRTLIKQVKSVAPVVQGRGAALLLDGRAEIAVRAGADGAHLADFTDFQEAKTLLQPARIAGCGGLDNRHDAMLAAEAGADYVMFGEPDENGYRPSFEAILERVGWWAEVFEVPCVGHAAQIEEVAALVTAGADFVALSDGIFAQADAHSMGLAVAEAARQLATTETVE
jgi:thiamine-phosphate pyrophosphorylase